MPEKRDDTKKRSAPPKTDWERVDAMTDEDIKRAAKGDPDARPVPDSWFARATKRRNPRAAE